jgi:hypothetical protein
MAAVSFDEFSLDKEYEMREGKVSVRHSPLLTLLASMMVRLKSSRLASHLHRSVH